MPICSDFMTSVVAKNEVGIVLMSNVPGLEGPAGKTAKSIVSSDGKYQ